MEVVVMNMKRVFTIIITLLVGDAAHAASGMVNLYIQSAAAWERCSGKTLSHEQADNFSKLIALHSLEKTAPEKILDTVHKAGRAVGASCEPVSEYAGFRELTHDRE